jgi:hypothetical protein
MSLLYYAKLLEDIASSQEWRQELYDEADQMLGQLPNHRLITGSFNTLLELNAQSTFTTFSGRPAKRNESELASLRAKLKEYASKLRGGLA